MNQHRRPSPAILVAVIALVAALAGTALAGPDATTSAITKKKAKKIARKESSKYFEANIGDAFARIENGEAFLYNADIQPYERASHEIPTAKRTRKLLLHRGEIDRLYGEAQVKGRALVVLKLYWKNGKVKAEVGVGIGKVAGDKRADLKKRAVDRETAREVARFNRKHA